MEYRNSSVLFVLVMCFSVNNLPGEGVPETHPLPNRTDFQFPSEESMTELQLRLEGIEKTLSRVERYAVASSYERAYVSSHGDVIFQLGTVVCAEIEDGLERQMATIQ